MEGYNDAQASFRHYEITKHTESISINYKCSFCLRKTINATEFLHICISIGRSPCYQPYGKSCNKYVLYSYKYYLYLHALQFQIEEEEKKLKAAIEEAEKLYSEVSSEMKDLEIKSKQFVELEERLVSVLVATILYSCVLV